MTGNISIAILDYDNLDVFEEWCGERVLVESVAIAAPEEVEL